MYNIDSDNGNNDTPFAINVITKGATRRRVAVRVRKLIKVIRFHVYARGDRAKYEYHDEELKSSNVITFAVSSIQYYRRVL